MQSRSVADSDQSCVKQRSSTLLTYKGGFSYQLAVDGMCAAVWLLSLDAAASEASKGIFLRVNTWVRSTFCM